MWNYRNLFVITAALCYGTHGSAAFVPSVRKPFSSRSGSSSCFAELGEPATPVAPPVPKPPMTAKMTMEELLREAEEEDDEELEPGGKLVPIKKETIEFTAGVLGGIAGFAVGGPWAAAIGAAMVNYLCKLPETDVGEAIVAVSTTTIEIYNFFAKLDTKYSVLESTQNSLKSTLDDLKSQNADSAAVKKVEDALSTTTLKIQDINEEYDFIGSGVSALGFMGEVVENSIKKAGELDSDYRLTNKAMSSIKKAVDKSKPVNIDE